MRVDDHIARMAIADAQLDVQEAKRLENLRKIAAANRKYLAYGRVQR